jgi:hypothetical protein
LALLRKQGFAAEIVERWVPGANVRRDLFRCIDIIALRPGSPILGVQATSGSNVAARLKKAVALPGLKVWLNCGCAFQVWGWQLQGGRWRVRQVAVRGEDLQPLDLTPRPRRRGGQKTLFDGLADVAGP